MLTCDQQWFEDINQMWRTHTRTSGGSAAVWFAAVLFALLFTHGSVLYVLLLDDHHTIHVLSLQVMPSAKYIMLLQICSVQLYCVAAVFRYKVCLTTTRARPRYTAQSTYLVISATC